jgi:hypothetical protein
VVPLSLVPGIEHPDRYLFLPWWGLSALAAVLLARLPRGPATQRLLLGGLLLSAAVAQGAREQAMLEPRLDMFDSVYRFALSGPRERVLVQDRVPDPLYMDLVLNGAIAARTALLATAPDRVHILVDRQQLPLLAGRGYRLWEYHVGCRCVREIAPGDPALKGPAPAIPARTLRVVSYGPPYPPLLSGVAGAVDRVRLEGARLSLAGWVKLKDHDPEQQLLLLTSEWPRTRSISVAERPDVVAFFDEPAFLHSGFVITLTYPDPASAQRAVRHLCLVTRSTLTSLVLVDDRTHPECSHLLGQTGLVHE